MSYIINYLVQTIFVFMLHCKSRLLLLRWYTDKVRDKFGGLFSFKGGLSYRVSSVIIDVTTGCNYRRVFLKYKYNVL